jgi:hypothetical protein
MNETVKANRIAWLEALRSGKYEQGKEALEQDGKFCCLGVACKVLMDRGYPIDRRVDASGAAHYHYEGRSSSGILPRGVNRLLGIYSDCGYTKNEDYAPALTTMNDRGRTFAEIADAIETGAYDA